MLAWAQYDWLSSYTTEWSEQEVIDKYLKPINMEHMAKVFLANKINGHVLVGLEVGLSLHYVCAPCFTLFLSHDCSTTTFMGDKHNVIHIIVPSKEAGKNIVPSEEAGTM